MLHYEILARLGVGATGETWAAEDLRLGRRVVLKFLPHATAAERGEALAHEARSLAALSHPAIAAIHALEHTDDDGPFLVMAFIDGETLRAVLQLGPLPVNDVVVMGLALAEALAHAHGRGIVHRDVKPENILVDVDGSVHLTDFGVAGLVATGHGTEGPTGTTGYMSPEQARGAAADPRSDVYALGVVLAEALVGLRPGELHIPMPQALRARSVPEDLARVVLRCIAPERRRRFVDGASVAAALEQVAVARGLRGSRWKLAAAVAVATLLVAGTFLLRRPAAALRDEQVQVLPFQVRGQSHDAGYLGEAFARGLALDMTHLSVPAVHFVPDAARDEATREAPAAWRVTGRLVREGTDIQASVALSDMRTNRELWATVMRRPDRELSGLTSALARELARALHATPPPLYDYYVYSQTSQALASSPIASEALAAVRRFDTEVAVAATERLVQAFPREPEARVLRAWALMHEGWEEGVRAPTRRLFEASLDSVRALDPRNPWPDVFTSVVRSRDGRLGGAVLGFSAVLDRNDLTPAARAHVLSLRGQTYRDLGDSTAALTDLEHALRIDGLSPVTLLILSDALGTFGQPDEALVRARQAVALSPDLAYANLTLAQAYGRLGRWEEAVDPVARACQAQPTHSFFAFQALVLEHAGRAAAAEESAREALAHGESDWGDESLARWHALRGEARASLALLERCVTLGWKDPELPAFPEFAAMRGHARFEAVAARVRAGLAAGATAQR